MNGSEYTYLKETIERIERKVDCMDRKLDQHCIEQSGKCATNDARIDALDSKQAWLYRILGAIVIGGAMAIIKVTLG